MSCFFAICCVFVQYTSNAEIQHQPHYDIPIGVIATHPIPYASDIQDISVDWGTDQIAIRSNGDGKIYLADGQTFELISEITMPSGIDGFGISTYNGSYFINSASTAEIFVSDGSDSWSSFPNPAGTDGAGMDFNAMGPEFLFEAAASSPYQFFSMEPDGSAYDSYSLPEVTGEISGFMGHEVATAGTPPSAIILTTRFDHEFLFYHCWGSITLYGQEPCPIPVIESLGLSWRACMCDQVLWSYKGMDENYYIAELSIPVFGGIEDESNGFTSQYDFLNISTNPATGSATLSLRNLGTDSSTLEVFDISGRQIELLHTGQLTAGEVNFTFEGSPGVYLAVLHHAGIEQSLKFILTD